MTTGLSAFFYAFLYNGQQPAIRLRKAPAGIALPEKKRKISDLLLQ